LDAPPVQYVKASDGYDIAYTACGSGLPLVHLPVVFNYFSLQWRSGIRREPFEALAERFRLYLYDGRGQGLSSRGSKSQISIESLESDLNAVLGLVEGSRSSSSDHQQPGSLRCATLRDTPSALPH